MSSNVKKCISSYKETPDTYFYQISFTLVFNLENGPFRKGESHTTFLER